MCGNWNITVGNKSERVEKVIVRIGLSHVHHTPNRGKKSDGYNIVCGNWNITIVIILEKVKNSNNMRGFEYWYHQHIKHG